MNDNRQLPLIIAHRGSSAVAPENTLAAFERALADGADGIELDVRLARDGIPVVFHDATLQRVAQLRRRVSDFTSDELQRVDVGAWFNRKNPRRAASRYAGETVPTLARLFDFLQGYPGRIYVELKGKTGETRALVEAVAAALRRTALLPNVVVKSFQLEAVKEAAALLPEIRTAALFAPKFASVLRRHSRVIEQAERVAANELSLHFSLATHKMAARAAARDLPITIWTADHPVWVRRAVEIGIRAIITNDPARLLAARGELLQTASAS